MFFFLQERIERQKAEGTYLTKAQKDAKRIAEGKLEALKQQGIIVPAKSGSKPGQKVRYVTNKRSKRDLNQGMHQS